MIGNWKLFQKKESEESLRVESNYGCETILTRWMSCRNSELGKGAVIVLSLDGGIPTVICFWWTSKSVTALARSSTRFPSMPAVWRTNPQFLWRQAFSYNPFSKSLTRIRLPSSIPPVRYSNPFSTMRKWRMSPCSSRLSESRNMCNNSSTCMDTTIHNKLNSNIINIEVYCYILVMI